MKKLILMMMFLFVGLHVSAQQTTEWHNGIEYYVTYGTSTDNLGNTYPTKILTQVQKTTQTTNFNNTRLQQTRTLDFSKESNAYWEAGMIDVWARKKARAFMWYGYSW